MPDKDLKYTTIDDNIIEISNFPKNMKFDEIMLEALNNIEGIDNLKLRINGIDYPVKEWKENYDSLQALKNGITEEDIKKYGKYIFGEDPPLTDKEFEDINRRSDYLGGNKIESALQYLDKVDPNIKNKIKSAAKNSGIDEKVFLQRLIKEGAFTPFIKNYNDSKLAWNRAIDHKFNTKLSEEKDIDAFYLLGLDRYGDLMNGNYTEAKAYQKVHSKRNIPYKPRFAVNDKDDKVTSATFNNIDDALQAKADYIKVLQDQIKSEYKRLYNKDVSQKTLNSLIPKFYNIGASKLFDKSISKKDLQYSNNYGLNPLIENYNFKNGGNLNYKENEIYDLDETEIDKLLKNGYELEYL